MTTLSCHLRKTRGAPELRFECFCLTACLAVCNDKSRCWVILQILDLVVAEKSQNNVHRSTTVRSNRASGSKLQMHSHCKHAGQRPTCFDARASCCVLATVRTAALAQGVRLHF